MRALIDATPVPAARVGVGTYVFELLRALDGLDDVDLEIFAKRADVGAIRGVAPQARLHPVTAGSRPVRLAWSHSVLPARVKRLRPDVFHGPHYTAPRGLGCPVVTTFHDPTFFTLPHLHERSKLAYFRRAAVSGIKRSARVIAVSEYAKRGAVEHAGADPERVDVVPLGVDTTRFRPDATAPERPYILFVGALEPRKDVPTLIAAYHELMRSGLPHDLICAGPPAWGADAVRRAAAEVSGGRIRLAGYVDEAEKIRLMQRASVFVYPSIAEGFGLPVLEAMACGTPVVTTSGSAPEEIAGDAAELVPAGDPEVLAAAIARVLGGDTADRVARGLAVARRFSWEAAARATVATWRRATA